MGLSRRSFLGAALSPLLPSLPFVSTPLTGVVPIEPISKAVLPMFPASMYSGDLLDAKLALIAEEMMRKEDEEWHRQAIEQSVRSSVG
jgi:hypothetical protein